LDVIAHRFRRLGLALIGGIAGLDAGMGDLEAQGWFATDGFHRIAHALRHLDQEALAGDKGLLALNGETDLAAPHHPEDAVVAVILYRRLVTGRGGNPFGVIAVGEDDLFAPARLALVL